MTAATSAPVYFVTPIVSLEDAMFEPDQVLPEQVFGRVEPRLGAHRLFVAMLEDALTRLKRDDVAGQEALAWFESDRDEWGSFLFVAEVLGICSIERVRELARGVASRKITIGRFHRRSGARTRVGGVG